MITATQVNELRTMTGAGMMDCKKALTEAEGDMDKAVDVLRKKGASKAAKKSDRETSEGLAFAKVEGGKGVAVLIGCETDFVAKNEKFQEFGEEIVNKAMQDGATAAKEDAESKITELIGVIGENMKVLDVEEISADTVASYIHTNGKIGVLVGLEGGTEEIAKDIAMHAAAMNPLVLNPADVSDEDVSKEKEIWADQLKQEGKPENIIENIMKGKEAKFRGEHALTAQSFVKDPSKTVEQFAKDGGATVVNFIRLAI